MSRRRPISLSDQQLQVLMAHAKGIPCPWRNRFLALVGDVAPMGTFPVGGPWPEGCSCDLGGGKYGILVKEGDRLVCRERQFGNGDASFTPDSAQAIRF
jgi:hypothetical protein